MAEASVPYARSVDEIFEGAGSIMQQPHFAAIARRDLMAAVNTTSKDLGIGPSAVMVLDALLSCLPCQDAKSGQDAPITPQTLLTVFACNATLCFRAKGITDRQLRRHLERLEELRLIQRRDSANGKRFPIKRGGKIVAAFGIDLSPLLVRADDIRRLAAIKRDQHDELRGLKAQIQALRQRCLTLSLSPEATAFLDTLSSVMRRVTLTVHHARELMSQLLAIASTKQTDESPEPKDQSQTQDQGQLQATCHVDETDLQPTTDGQNVRHKEPKDPDSKKIGPIAGDDLWDELITVREFYPTPPKTAHDLMRVLCEICQMLRIGQATLAKAVTAIGLDKTLRIADFLAREPDRFRNPDGYLLGVVRHAG